VPKPFALFYHIWCPSLPVCRFLVDEQLKRIFRSGLPNNADVIACISGAHHNEIRNFISQYPWVTVAKSTEDESQFEGLTLERLHAHCRDNPSLDGVGYVHTKGIRFFSTDCDDTTFKAVNSWRHFLEWGVIDRWKDAVTQLSGFDAVGVNYRRSPWPHFSGNFWWTSPRYVRTLIAPICGNFPEFNYSWISETQPDRKKLIDRLQFERWIGINNPKIFSFYGGYPFLSNGVQLPEDSHNLYKWDIEPYYRTNGF
jgi:hypothetical protein